MPDAGHSGDVVDLVAREREIVGEALGSDAEVTLDVVIAELPARAEVPEQVAVAHQLGEILVARDERRAHSLRTHAGRKRADDVIGLVLGVDEECDSQAAAQLAAAFELPYQIRRRALAVRLVARIDAAA